MIDSNKIVKQFIQLTQIDAPSYCERTMGDYVIEQLTDLGFHIVEDKAGELIGGDCGNIYGYLKGELPGESIMLSSHLDTVEPAKGKCAVIQKDGRITSDGTTVLGADDAAGIAAILEGLRYVIENKISHKSIEVLFTVAEEVYGEGALVFDYQTLKSKEAYVLDLSGKIGRAAYKAPTILSFKIQVNGKAAHAGFEPEKGVHAIGIAAKAIGQLTLGHWDQDSTLNIGTIEGGIAGNIVPEHCFVTGEIRSYSNEKASSILSEVKDVFETVANENNGSIEVSEKFHIIAYELDKKDTVIRRYERACETLNIPAEIVSTFGGSDNNIFALKGIHGLVISSAMNQVHSTKEYTSVEDLVKSTEIVVELITDTINY